MTSDIVAVSWNISINSYTVPLPLKDASNIHVSINLEKSTNLTGFYHIIICQPMSSVIDRDENR